MSKVAGTRMIRLTARATRLSVFQDTHAWIKQASNLRLVAFIRGLRRDLHHRTALNFLWRKNAELDADDRLDIRRSLIESCWHSVLDVEVV